MQERKFSVLVIAHGRTGHLRSLLEGVGRSTELPHEVVLVYMDEPYPEPVACCVPLRVLHVSTGVGDAGLPLARARNTAARAAEHPNLVFLDVDCIPSRTLFTALLDALQTGPVLAMAEPRYLRGPLEEAPAAGDASLLAASVSHHARKHLARNTNSSHHEMFWSLGFAIEAKVFAPLGGFDEGFAGYGAEDTDLAFRARVAGVPMRFVVEPLFHQHHAVHKPPLNHFDAIVLNARAFHARWDTWPMEGWLGAFTSMGLLEWDPLATEISVRRVPTEAEIHSSQSNEPY
ncbi:glycosyltransferase family 2 protein [Paeniglutamicibacter antarcticus]|uniref:Glycosyltransferase n=1 Tax=Paeniglutamicibacter antarcticus TaxID=494023 RepID=A0ABP9TV34_9MICC